MRIWFWENQGEAPARFLVEGQNGDVKRVLRCTSRNSGREAFSVSASLDGQLPIIHSGMYSRDIKE